MFRAFFALKLLASHKDKPSLPKIDKQMNNKKKGIIIVIAAYIALLVAAYFIINAHIKTKDEKLRREIFNSISEMFGGDRLNLVDVDYHGKNVVYKQMDIPERPSKKLSSDDVIPRARSFDIEGNSMIDIDIDADWKDYYGDLFKLYRISNDESGAWPGYHEDGWNLVRINNVEYSQKLEWLDKVGGPQISIEWIFPYAVGLKRQERSYYYDFIPSVETAVEEAFEFFISNPKSNFLSDNSTDQFYNGKLERGCYSRIRNAMSEAANEYYWIKKDDQADYWHWGKPLFGDYTNYDKRTSPMEHTYMYNGYYRVFVGRTQPITYSVYRQPWHPEKSEKKKLLLWFGIGITLLMLGAIIPLTVLYKREEKTANEGLQDKLKRLCNPANFIKQYDKDKVEKANAIYQQLLTGNLDNEKLMALQAQAVNELGIALIDDQLLKRLKEKVNPQRYMKPYDAEKVSLANELFSRINKEELTYEEFVEIEKESEKL